MSKSLLIINSAPKACEQWCPAFRIYDGVYGYCCADEKKPKKVPLKLMDPKDHVWSWPKPVWCPLKEMPEHLPETGIADILKWRNSGWNDCVDYLEKGDED